MGYRKKSKVYRIRVESGEHTGLDMTVRAVKLGKFVSIARMSTSLDVETLKSGKGTTVTDATDTFSGMTELFDEFSKSLVSWNVEAPTDPDLDGENDEWIPVPANQSGVYAQEFDFVMFLIGEWIGAMGGIPDPLERKPNEGENSNDVASLETELELLSRPLSQEQS